jgi:16S rRNA (guanine966-N2)-methyltransferase
MSLRIIAGKFKGHLLKTPKGDATRPTQTILRGAVFNICQNAIENASFLDLFAGSGSMGFEALSRGASHVTFIENERNAIAALRANIAHLHVEQTTTLYPYNYTISLKKLPATFDIIYVDPPYNVSPGPVLALILPLLKPTTLLFLEQRFSPTAPRHFSSLSLIDSRRFGDALLQQYALSATS